MKKVILLLAFISLNEAELFAIPIIKIHKHGGLFGRWFYHTTQALIPGPNNSGYGWSINCRGAGFNKCADARILPGGDGESGPTKADLEIAAKLIDLVEGSCDNEGEMLKSNSKTGSISRQFSVDGQAPMVYTITWKIVGEGYQLEVEKNPL